MPALPVHWEGPAGGPPKLRATATADAYVLLYRGTGLACWAIRKQTRSPYAHAAILLPDPADRACGMLVEAVPGGCVETRYTSLRHEPADAFAVRGLNTTALYHWLARQIGKPYDWSSVVRFVTRKQASRESAGRWFCSELVFAALAKGGVVLFARTAPWEVSPGLLARSPLLEQEA